MKNRREIISALSKDKTWTTIPSGKSAIIMSRRQGKKSVTLTLTIVPHKKGLYNLMPVDYPYFCKTSHFDYGIGGMERRLCRNKGIFKSLFKALNKAGILNQIANIDTYISINKTNDKSDKGKLSKQLDDMRKYL